MQFQPIHKLSTLVMCYRVHESVLSQHIYLIFQKLLMLSQELWRHPLHLEFHGRTGAHELKACYVLLLFSIFNDSAKFKFARIYPQM